ncbi:MAG: GNAT family N-acetyltransferase [Anaerolineae bacterium]|nr:GNAT family N-acetyltransferase [Anaerolineae bacterium]
MWKTSKLTDKFQILAFLETDRLYGAYAIGDLEPGMFVQSAWAGAERDGRMEALVLHFCGLKPPALLLMGDPDGLRAILEDVLCPEWVYLTCRTKHLPVACDFYEWNETIPMWRMVLQPARFRPVGGDCARLTPAHSDQLAELYALGGGNAFGPAQVPHGVFYGVLADGRLVAAAGTHLVSPTYGVAAVGNIFTHPDYRGRGYGTATTSAVLSELVQHGIRDVVLNVDQKNESAIRIYERLGFERYCPFLEGPATRRMRQSQKDKDIGGRP